jgi:hypothetical protein
MIMITFPFDIQAGGVGGTASCRQSDPPTPAFEGRNTTSQITVNNPISRVYLSTLIDVMSYKLITAGTTLSKKYSVAAVSRWPPPQALRSQD